MRFCSAGGGGDPRVRPLLDPRRGRLCPHGLFPVNSDVIWGFLIFLFVNNGARCCVLTPSLSPSCSSWGKSSDDGRGMMALTFKENPENEFPFISGWSSSDAQRTVMKPFYTPVIERQTFSKGNGFEDLRAVINGPMKKRACISLLNVQEVEVLT